MTQAEQEVPSRAHRVLWRLALALAAVSLIGFADGLWWVFDLFSHFRLHYEVAALLLALYAGVARAWRPLALCGALFLLNGWPLADLLGGAPGAQPDPVRVVSLNVQMDAPRGRTLSWLGTVDADLVALQEVDAAFMMALGAQATRWPHRVARPREDFMGLALLSRWPILAHGALAAGPDAIDAVLWARVQAPSGPLDVVVAHPLPPMTARFWAQRNRVVEGLAGKLDELGPRVVVAGDFNAAPWSAALAPLRDAGLVHGRVGRGHQASWPAGWPMLGVPIDHVFVRGLAVVGHRIGPQLGGDHLPILAELAPLGAGR